MVYSAMHVWSCFCLLYRRHIQLDIYGHVFVCYTVGIISYTYMVMFLCVMPIVYSCSCTCTVMFLRVIPIAYSAIHVWSCFFAIPMAYPAIHVRSCFLCAIPMAYSAIHVRSYFCVLCRLYTQLYMYGHVFVCYADGIKSARHRGTGNFWPTLKNCKAMITEVELHTSKTTTTKSL